MKDKTRILYQGDGSYAELAEVIGAHSGFCLLTDSNTKNHCRDLFINKLGVEADLEIEIPAGESNKSVLSAQLIWKELIEAGYDRKSVIVNLGGGMISDLGGFSASNYKRGINYINVPTSLLSMVDAAHGGKTAINFEETKNIIGSFHFPEITLIDIGFLRTLPEEEFKSGFAEIIKHALIADKDYWNEIKTVDALSGIQDLPSLINKSVEIKNEIVAKDPSETGLRKVLNFGHTIGHALESKYSLKHGHAVALGIIGEAWISMEMKLLSAQLFEELSSYINRLYAVEFDNSQDESALIELMLRDKKNEKGNFRFTLLETIGSPVYDREVDVELIKGALHFISSLK